MSSEENPSIRQESGLATIELAGAPEEVLQGIECSQDGLCTISLAGANPSNVSREELDREGDDRSLVGDAPSRGGEAAEAPAVRSSTRTSSSSSGVFTDVNRDVRYAVRMDKTRTTRHLDDLRGMYHSAADLRRDLATSLLSANLLPREIVIDDNNFFIGFIRPGHGAKGQKVSVACDEDLAQMYEVCRSRRNDILLWYSMSKEAARAYETYDVYIPSTNVKQKQASSPPSVKRRKPQATTPNSGGGWPAVTSPTLAAVATGTVYPPHLSPTAASTALKGDSSRSSTSDPPISPGSLAVHVSPQSAHRFLYPPMPMNRDRGSHLSATASAAQMSAYLSATSPRPALHSPTSSGVYPVHTLIANGDGQVDGSAAAMPAYESASWSLQVLKDRAEVRKVLIQQLRDWSDLRHADVITEDVFTSHKAKILADLDSL